MARLACIRAEVEKWRAEVAMGGNDRIRILDIVVLAHGFRTHHVTMPNHHDQDSDVAIQTCQKV